MNKDNSMSEDQHSRSTIETIDYKRTIYSLNIEEKTASLIRFKNKKRFFDNTLHIMNNSICFPASVNYKSKEYILTSISECAFKYNHSYYISFAPDSKLLSIDKEAFINSFIDGITIPSQVTHIGERAFYDSEYLNTLIFAPDSKLQTLGKEAFQNIKNLKKKSPFHHQ